MKNLCFLHKQNAISVVMTVLMVLALIIPAASVFAADTYHGHIETIETHAGSSSYGEDGHHGDHHKKSEGLPQFNPDSYPSQLFWLFVTFAFLYVFFAKKTLPEISNVLENRKSHIESHLEEAETLRTKSEETQRLYESGLESARKEAAQMVYDLQEEIQETAMHKNEFFIEKSKHEIAELEKSLDKAKTDAMGEMNTIAAEIASAAAEKIVGVSTDIDTVKDVVESLNTKKKAA